ncbi:hypothetical protein DYB31_000611 [Aphanomyces astaci]|uniref:Uncharacterized protein n=1 Tax=Aphanomyces astaci TaxID=112090 RepID=A0A397F2I6_APHAT|nr:hypothetical protein DYB31_000611 [Aphanomyces astaci]
MRQCSTSPLTTDAAAVLQDRIDQLQDQVFRYSIDLANRDKALRVQQHDQGHKDELLKRLDTMLETAKADKEALQAAHDALLAQRDTLKRRLDLTRGSDEHDLLKHQIQVLRTDKLQLLQDLARVVLERDVAIDDVARGRRKIDHIRRILATVVMEKKLQQIRASWHDLRTQSQSDMTLLAAFHREYAVITSTYRRYWPCSTRKTQHIQHVARTIQETMARMHKPKPKKQPLISIPSTKSVKQLGSVVKPPPSACTSATTQTNSEDGSNPQTTQSRSNELAEHLTKVLLPVLEATETKLMAVMDKVERQKLDLLAAYEREAELRNRLQSSSAVAPPLSLGHAARSQSPINTQQPTRQGTPAAIVQVRHQLLAMTSYVTHWYFMKRCDDMVECSGDENANLALHVADLYDMLHTNLDVLEAALDDGPVLYLDHCNGSQGAIVTDGFDPSVSPRRTNNNDVSPPPGRRLFKPSKTSSRTLFPVADPPPMEPPVVDVSPFSTLTDATSSHSATVSTLNISIRDGEIQNVPAAVRKRVNTVVLKLAAAALFQDSINVHDMVSLFLTADHDVDVWAHGVQDIRDDQLIQNHVPAFSLTTATASPPSHTDATGTSSHQDKLNTTELQPHASSGTKQHPAARPVVKVVTRLLDLVGTDMYAADKEVAHTRTWLVKQIRSIFHDKYMAESLEYAAFHAVLALPEFIVQWSFLKFGVKELVARTCHAIMDGTNEWKATTPEVSLFAGFLAEQGNVGYGKSDLSLFLHARQLVVDCVGDMRPLGHDDVPRLTSTQAVHIVHRVFQTLVHCHRPMIFVKLDALLKPTQHETDGVARVDDEPTPLDSPPILSGVFEFQGLPMASTLTPSGSFPEGKIKTAIASFYLPDPKLILESALDSAFPIEGIQPSPYFP